MALTANQLANAYFSVTDTIPNAALLASLQAIDSTQGDAAAISAIVNDAVSIEFAFPIIRIFQLVTGNVPGATQLHGWEGFVEGGGSLTQIAVAFASGTFFQNNYNAGNPVNPNGPANLTEMINIISNALNLPTSSATVQGNAQAWVTASNAPGGPTLAQIIVAFATGDQFSAETLANVQAYLTQIATANELTTAPVPGSPPTNGFPPPAQSGTGVSLFSFLPAGGTQTLTLTVGQDTAITGQLFNGTGPMVLGGGVVVNAPIGGLFGNQNTLTAFDDVSLTGSGNTLNAFLAGGGVIGGLTLQGLQTWNLSHTGATATLAGSANLGGGAPGVGNMGVQTINYQNSTGAMILGTPGGVGLQSLVQTINMTNSAGAGLEAVISSALFTAASALTVNVSNSTGSAVLAVSDGAGAAGYATWNVAVQDAVGDTIALGDSGVATTVNLTDPGGGTLTLLSAGGMTKVGTVNGSAMTAALTVTGAETAGGFLVGNTALKTITGGTGNDTFDLSGFGTTAIQGMTSINGGGGTNRVDIAIGVATDTATPLKPLTNLSNEQIIGLTGNTGGAATVNVANFNQGTATDTALTTFDLVAAAGGGLGITLGGNLSFTKMTSGLTVDIDNTNLGGFNLAFTDVSTSSTTDTFTLEEAANANVGGTITTNGFGTVTLQTDAAGNTLAAGGFIANANPGGGITLDFTSGAGATGPIFLGATGGLTAASVGTPSIVTHNGVINDNSAADVVLGITDAPVINASASTATGVGEGLFMAGPTDFSGATHVTGAPGASNLLEGALTGLTADAGGPGFIAATLSNDSITGGTFGGDFIWGDGGQDAITFGVGHTNGDTVVFGEVGLDFNGPGSAGNPILEFTNNTGTYVNAPAGFTTTTSFASTIANFNPTIDAIDFRAGAWGFTGGAAAYGGLVDGAQAQVTAGAATQFQVITSAGATILGPTNVVGDAVATYADDAHFLTALQGGGGLVLTGPLVGFDDILFAFSDGSNVHIAEVRLATGSTTTGGALAVHDLAVLTGVSAVASLTNGDIHFV